MRWLPARRSAGHTACIVAVTICACAATGCGKSSNRLSKSEYAKQADAICGVYFRQVKALGTPSPPTAAGLAKVATQTLSLLDTAIAHLHALKPPEDEQALATQWLVSLHTLRADVVAVRNRANANDLDGIRELVPIAQRHNRQSNVLARRLAMEVCDSDED
ncbi:MAG TPA: hypothetical protein VEH52_14390 [Gaiellaceae bacterium]|nr:hypothetical protein [Gaiellaceae bacterium]